MSEPEPVELVACTTDTCEAHGVVIENPFGYPLELIRCGACGGPVATVEPEPEPES